MISTPLGLNAIDFVSILDSLDEGVIITDTEGVITYYNQTQAKIDDIDAEFVIGKKVTDIYELNGDTSLIMLCLKRGKPIRNLTFFYKTVFGKIANTICSTFPIQQGSRMTGVICLVKDYQLLRRSAPAVAIPDFKPHKTNGTRYTFADIIGQNHTLLQSIETSRAAADSPSPVMLIGETGTGKELFAQSIHNQSHRNKNSFVAVNCAAIPETLLEGLLFGTTRGAFTGAMDKPGLLEHANGSTLFLDELLCMPVSLQVKLLRVLQENKVQRIGSTKEISLDVKIVSSMNKSPREAIALNELRIDLFYRIGVVMVKIPPLRERLDDLPALVNYFILTLNNSLGTNVHRVDDQVMNHFYNYHWPGNIRELEHLLEGALNIVGYDEDLTMKYFSPADTMDQPNLEPLPANMTSSPPALPVGPELIPEDFMASQTEREMDALKRVLLRTNGNISRASAILGISRQLFHYKMKKHGLCRDQFFNNAS